MVAFSFFPYVVARVGHHAHLVGAEYSLTVGHCAPLWLHLIHDRSVTLDLTSVTLVFGRAWEQLTGSCFGTQLGLGTHHTLRSAFGRPIGEQNRCTAWYAEKLGAMPPMRQQKCPLVLGQFHWIDRSVSRPLRLSAVNKSA